MEVKRFALGALLVWSSAACVSTPITPAVPAGGAALPRAVRVQFTEEGVTVVREVPLEEYVQATALSEVAPAAGDVETVERMLEVQTIIGRTYAVSHLGRHAREGFDLCSTTHCQLFDPRRLRTSRWAAASSEAVARTAGRHPHVRSPACAGAVPRRLRRLHEHVVCGVGRCRSALPRRAARRGGREGRARRVAVRGLLGALTAALNAQRPPRRDRHREPRRRRPGGANRRAEPRGARTAGAAGRARSFVETTFDNS